MGEKDTDSSLVESNVQDVSTLPTRVTAPPRGRAPVMRYRVTWCSLSSPVACHAKIAMSVFGAEGVE
eukprot:5883691-Prymnesium_polylepis.1